jgi:hypothetical protein
MEPKRSDESYWRKPNKAQDSCKNGHRKENHGATLASNGSDFVVQDDPEILGGGVTASSPSPHSRMNPRCRRLVGDQSLASPLHYDRTMTRTLTCSLPPINATDVTLSTNPMTHTNTHGRLPL